jgi:fructokinase
MPEIITMGEGIIDFTYDERDDGIFYKQNAGGAPANVAAAVKKLGTPSAFIGKVGNDIFGTYLINELGKAGVDTSGIVRDKSHPTPLAFIKTEAGRREYSFMRQNTADMNLKYDEVALRLIDNAKILHFGALLLAEEPSRSAVANTVEHAKQKGKIISYSLNYRPQLWKNHDDAAIAMRSVLSFVDILKVSEDELELIADSGNLLPSVCKLLSGGIKIILVTQGAKGCIVAAKSGVQEVRAYKIPIVDTLGAGDSFIGAFLSRIAAVSRGYEDLTMAELNEIAAFSNAAGAVCSSRVGALAAMPTKDEIEEFRAGCKDSERFF